MNGFRLYDTEKNRYKISIMYRMDCDGKVFLGDSDIQETDVIIELCTGLADKNDKLIYEGDVFEAIVLNSCDCDENIGKRIRGQVAYFTDNACFTFAAYSPINLGEIEIIGNIHDDQFREVTKMMEE